MKLILTDDRVWDPMRKTAELMLEIQRNGKVIIDLHGEGPDLFQTMLPEFFNYIKSQGVDTSKITILTANAIEDYSGVNIVFEPKTWFEIIEFKKNLAHLPTHKNIKYYFGNLIGRTTLPRLIIASHLYANYKNITFQTFHYDSSSHYHKTHLELDKLLHEYGANSVEFNEAVQLLKAAPLLKEEAQQYPILYPENTFAPCKWYPQFAIDIICETWYQGQNFFVNEKLWRAIVTKTPFIIHGSQNILTNLRKLGFETFSDYWDEGYQEDPSFCNIISIKNVIAELAHQPLDEINWILYNMKDLLDHNYNVFMNLSENDIVDLLNN